MKRRWWPSAILGTGGALRDRWLIWLGSIASGETMLPRCRRTVRAWKSSPAWSTGVASRACWKGSPVWLCRGETQAARSRSRRQQRVCARRSAPHCHKPSSESSTNGYSVPGNRSANGRGRKPGRKGQKCPWIARFNSRWLINSRLRQFLRPDEPAYGGNPAGWNLGLGGMLENQGLVRSKVDAVNLVFGDVAVQPLNLRPNFLQRLERAQRNFLNLRFRKR